MTIGDWLTRFDPKNEIVMINIDLLVQYGAVYKKVSAGEMIFLEGGLCLYYHQLVEGKVAWSNFNDDGKEVLQELVSAGECFGELPLFDHQGYACTSVALTDCLILRLPSASFSQMLDEQPQIALAFNRLLARKMRFKMFLLRELAGHSPEKIVDKLLRYLHEHSDKVCDTCNKLLLTRQQIANLTGMRVETVIRATRALENQGRVNIVKGKVFLTSPKGNSDHCERGLGTVKARACQ